MSAKARTTSLQSVRAPGAGSHEKAEMQGGHQPKSAIKAAFKDRRASNRERKMALQQDVDKLKKRLRQEENIHRALERAFSRPLGALPRLPPYLPTSTLELLAEVAVLEEEVVRLEEQVVHFRQDLYQEAVHLSSSKRGTENDSVEPSTNNTSKLEQPAVLTRTLSKIIHLQALSDGGQGKENKSLSDLRTNKSLKIGQPATLTRQMSKIMQVQSVSGGQLDQGQVKEKLSGNDSTKTSNKATLEQKSQLVRTPIKRSPPSESKLAEKRFDPQRSLLESRLQEQDSSQARSLAASDEQSIGCEGPNRISEEMVKCLSSIMLRMSSIKSRGGTDLQDPYKISPASGRTDIGPYQHLLSIEANSVYPKTMSNSFFLLHRLKILFERLSYVKLQNLSHQEKLAFWINIYNSCMMNAFLEHGIPESPEVVVELMRKATINVGGYLLNAITTEHFILRLPYHLKYTLPKGLKNDEMSLRSMFGLELSEPLVTFALCCGSWSSPAVRVYTAAHVEKELEVAKREYLQAAITISSTRLVIPKLLDWYLLDFAKDLESLLDWICLQLPSDVGKEAIKYLERAESERLPHFVQVMPYDFSFRYLIST